MFTPPNEHLKAGGIGPGSNKGCSGEPAGPSPFNTGRGAAPTGDRFDVAGSKMPQPPSAVQPGRGAIPIYPPPRVDVHIPDAAFREA